MDWGFERTHVEHLSCHSDGVGRAHEVFEARGIDARGYVFVGHRGGRV
jgi:hypothetical protein